MHASHVGHPEWSRDTGWLYVSALSSKTLCPGTERESHGFTDDAIPECDRSNPTFVRLSVGANATLQSSSPDFLESGSSNLESLTVHFVSHRVRRYLVSEPPKLLTVEQAAAKSQTHLQINATNYSRQ